MEMQDSPLGSGTLQHERAPLAGGFITQVKGDDRDIVNLFHQQVLWADRVVDCPRGGYFSKIALKACSNLVGIVTACRVL